MRISGVAKANVFLASGIPLIYKRTARKTLPSTPPFDNPRLLPRPRSGQGSGQAGEALRQAQDRLTVVSGFRVAIEHEGAGCHLAERRVSAAPAGLGFLFLVVPGLTSWATISRPSGAYWITLYTNCESALAFSRRSAGGSATGLRQCGTYFFGAAIRHG